MSWAEVYEYLVKQITENDFAAGAVIGGALAAVWATVKSWPSAIWPRIRRLLIFEVTVEQSDFLYAYLNKWISDNYPQKLKNVEAYLQEKPTDRMNIPDVLLDKEGEKEDEGNLKLRHHEDFIFIRRGLNILRIDKARVKLDNAESFKMAHMGTISIKGVKARKTILKILDECLKYQPKKEEDKLRRNVWTDGYWETISMYTTKTVNHIFFPGKEEIISDIKKFQDSKEWYASKAIPYKRGYLFKGRPGSGKTSFALALGRLTGRRIYTLGLTSMKDLAFRRAYSHIPPNSLLILDDMDIGLQSRDNKDKELVTLQTLLSHLDGSDSREDIVVIMITNCPEKLDSALIRKGRIDLVADISYPDKRSVEDYIGMFYGSGVRLPKGLDYNKPMVDVQEICIGCNTATSAKKEIIELFNSQSHEN